MEIKDYNVDIGVINTLVRPINDDLNKRKEEREEQIKQNYTRKKARKGVIRFR